ncbi:YqcC family protein [Vibrio fluvialis]|uniref:YqcC family protein n=1 Tax=Vibrio fluvialis TaxID=676 RepID=UPI001ABDBB3D|nr:YqcC family protein [Vibrio fluvialis]HDM8035092.1 YqcC family protein [Vibrio fluvialis clinical-1]EKO3412929.1 YqcC family protein [Vibrio fluvialis]EKO3422106.1 YqcC family protein [Vibrio fluvialis]EKO3522567.1 YqcC family protein [Vibrio fluvialis]EKO3525844.1 YqcC family protein [Vibrio fluvialis]
MTAATLFVLLQQLEDELRQSGVWQTAAPAEHALQSTQPFALDTLEPHEWLQWIFLPRMQQMIEQQMTLPSGFLLSPYFEEVWKEREEFAAVMLVLNRIDRVCQ